MEITLTVVELAVVYIALLLSMGITAVSIVNDDIEFTDEPTVTMDKKALKRIIIKGMIFLASMIIYIFMIIHFKFID